MKTVNVKIKYDNNDKSISVFFDADSLLLLSDTKKELNAKEIYDMFKYENGKKYILNDLDNYDDISEDNQYYLNECHKIFKNIIDGLEIPEKKKISIYSYVTYICFSYVCTVSAQQFG